VLLPLAFLDPQITRELLDGRRQVSGGLIEMLRRGFQPIGSNSEWFSKLSRSEAGLGRC
jgi:hypothetical protein